MGQKSSKSKHFIDGKSSTTTTNQSDDDKQKSSQFDERHTTLKQNAFPIANTADVHFVTLRELAYQYDFAMSTGAIDTMADLSTKVTDLLRTYWVRLPHMMTSRGDTLWTFAIREQFSASMLSLMHRAGAHNSLHLMSAGYDPTDPQQWVYTDSYINKQLKLDSNVREMEKDISPLKRGDGVIAHALANRASYDVILWFLEAGVDPFSCNNLGRHGLEQGLQDGVPASVESIELVLQSTIQQLLFMRGILNMPPESLTTANARGTTQDQLAFLERAKQLKLLSTKFLQHQYLAGGCTQPRYTSGGNGRLQNTPVSAQFLHFLHAVSRGTNAILTATIFRQSPSILKLLLRYGALLGDYYLHSKSWKIIPTEQKDHKLNILASASIGRNQTNTVAFILSSGQTIPSTYFPVRWYTALTRYYQNFFMMYSNYGYNSPIEAFLDHPNFLIRSYFQGAYETPPRLLHRERDTYGAQEVYLKNNENAVDSIITYYNETFNPLKLGLGLGLIWNDDTGYIIQQFTNYLLFPIFGYLRLGRSYELQQVLNNDLLGTTMIHLYRVQIGLFLIRVVMNSHQAKILFGNNNTNVNTTITTTNNNNINDCKDNDSQNNININIGDSNNNNNINKDDSEHNSYDLPLIQQNSTALLYTLIKLYYIHYYKPPQQQHSLGTYINSNQNPTVDNVTPTPYTSMNTEMSQYDKMEYHQQNIQQQIIQYQVQHRDTIPYGNSAVTARHILHLFAQYYMKVKPEWARETSTTTDNDNDNEQEQQQQSIIFNNDITTANATTSSTDDINTSLFHQDGVIPDDFNEFAFTQTLEIVQFFDSKGFSLFDYIMIGGEDWLKTIVQHESDQRPRGVVDHKLFDDVWMTMLTTTTTFSSPVSAESLRDAMLSLQINNNELYGDDDQDEDDDDGRDADLDEFDVDNNNTNSKNKQHQIHTSNQTQQQHNNNNNNSMHNTNNTNQRFPSTIPTTWPMTFIALLCQNLSTKAMPLSKVTSNEHLMQGTIWSNHTLFPLQWNTYYLNTATTKGNVLTIESPTRLETTIPFEQLYLTAQGAVPDPSKTIGSTLFAHLRDVVPFAYARMALAENTVNVTGNNIIINNNNSSKQITNTTVNVNINTINNNIQYNTSDYTIGHNNNTTNDNDNIQMQIHIARFNALMDASTTLLRPVIYQPFSTHNMMTLSELDYLSIFSTKLQFLHHAETLQQLTIPRHQHPLQYSGELLVNTGQVLRDINIEMKTEVNNKRKRHPRNTHLINASIYYDKLIAKCGDFFDNNNNNNSPNYHGKMYHDNTRASDIVGHSDGSSKDLNDLRHLIANPYYFLNQNKNNQTFKRPITIDNLNINDSYHNTLVVSKVYPLNEPLKRYGNIIEPVYYYHPSLRDTYGVNYGFNHHSPPGLLWYLLLYSPLNMDDLQTLLEYCRSDICNNYLQTPLMYMFARHAPIQTINVTLNKMINVNQQDVWARTALHYYTMTGASYDLGSNLNYLHHFLYHKGLLVDIIDVYHQIPLTYGLWAGIPLAIFNILMDMMISYTEQQFENVDNFEINLNRGKDILWCNDIYDHYNPANIAIQYYKSRSTRNMYEKLHLLFDEVGLPQQEQQQQEEITTSPSPFNENMLYTYIENYKPSQPHWECVLSSTTSELIQNISQQEQFLPQQGQQQQQEMPNIAYDKGTYTAGPLPDVVTSEVSTVDNNNNNNANNKNNKKHEKVIKTTSSTHTNPNTINPTNTNTTNTNIKPNTPLDYYSKLNNPHNLIEHSNTYITTESTRQFQSDYHQKTNKPSIRLGIDPYNDHPHQAQDMTIKQARPENLAPRQPGFTIGDSAPILSPLFKTPQNINIYQTLQYSGFPNHYEQQQQSFSSLHQINNNNDNNTINHTNPNLIFKPSTQHVSDQKHYQHQQQPQSITNKFAFVRGNRLVNFFYFTNRLYNNDMELPSYAARSAAEIKQRQRWEQRDELDQDVSNAWKIMGFNVIKSASYVDNQRYPCWNRFYTLKYYDAYSRLQSNVAYTKSNIKLTFYDVLLRSFQNNSLLIHPPITMPSSSYWELDNASAVQAQYKAELDFMTTAQLSYERKYYTTFFAQVIFGLRLFLWLQDGDEQEQQQEHQCHQQEIKPQDEENIENHNNNDNNNNVDYKYTKNNESDERQQYMTKYQTPKSTITRSDQQPEYCFMSSTNDFQTKLDEQQKQQQKQTIDTSKTTTKATHITPQYHTQWKLDMLRTHPSNSSFVDEEEPIINTILLDQYITDIINPNLGLTINPELHNHRHFIIPTEEVYKINNTNKNNDDDNNNNYNNDWLYYNTNSLKPFYYHPNQPLIENNIISTYQHLDPSKHYNLINDFLDLKDSDDKMKFIHCNNQLIKNTQLQNIIYQLPIGDDRSNHTIHLFSRVYNYKQISPSERISLHNSYCDKKTAVKKIIQKEKDKNCYNPHRSSSYNSNGDSDVNINEPIDDEMSIYEYDALEDEPNHPVHNENDFLVFGVNTNPASYVDHIVKYCIPHIDTVQKEIERLITIEKLNLLFYDKQQTMENNNTDLSTSDQQQRVSNPLYESKFVSPPYNNMNNYNDNNKDKLIEPIYLNYLGQLKPIMYYKQQQHQHQQAQHQYNKQHQNSTLSCNKNYNNNNNNNNTYNYTTYTSNNNNNISTPANTNNINIHNNNNNLSLLNKQNINLNKRYYNKSEEMKILYIILTFYIPELILYQISGATFYEIWNHRVFTPQLIKEIKLKLPTFDEYDKYFNYPLHGIQHYLAVVFDAAQLAMSWFDELHPY